MSSNKDKWNIGRVQEKAIKRELESAKVNGETDRVQGLAADLRRKQAEQERLLKGRE